MKKIANIISEKELVNHQKLDWINYYLIQGEELPVFDKALPTLVIGWNRFQQFFSYLYPDILNKNDYFSLKNISWEFSMEEKVVDYFNGIESFVKTAPRKYVETYNYQSFDPVSDQIKSEKSLVDILTPMRSYYVYKNEIVYLVSHESKLIIGIYLTAFEFFGFSIDTILSLLNAKFSAKTIDSDGSIYQSFYRKFPDFDQLKRAMILFLS